MSGTVLIKSGSETNLLSAVAYVGPIAVAVDGSNSGFRVRTYLCIVGQMEGGVVKFVCTANF